MKIILGLAAAFALVAGAAHAQTAPAPGQWQVYASGGYTYAHASESGVSVNLGAITGRLGARYGAYLGLEGEGSFGVADDKISGVTVKLDNQYAGYVVGYLPVAPRFDLLARVGYGHAELKASGFGLSGSTSGSTWNYGVGAQYSFGAHSAVRAEYTQIDSTDSNGGSFDTGTVSYVYKF